MIALTEVRTPKAARRQDAQPSPSPRSTGAPNRAAMLAQIRAEVALGTYDYGFEQLVAGWTGVRTR